MDFSKMTGYEFEDYISALLTKMGFKVSQTGYSHDGGIDLLAVYEKPIFSGKYIVQCKNYTGYVGQPEVRDLYGVVMSENANKGILITPSDYTEQAYIFAQNKNIELINGAILHKLIADNGDMPVAEQDGGENGFNRVQYDYLMQCIDNDPTSPKFYLQALELLRNYVMEDAPFINAVGVFDKIIDLNTRMIKRCYKKKNELTSRKVCWYRIAEAEILRGNLGVATNILLDNDWFYLKEWIPGVRTTSDPSAPEYICSYMYKPLSKNPLARNLFAAYKQIGFELGCKEITKYTNLDQELTDRRNIMLRFEHNKKEIMKREEIFSAAVEEYKRFLAGEFDDTFIFSKISASYDKYNGHRVDSQLKSLDKYGTISGTKKYYTKNSEETIRDILVAFQQHGISVPGTP